MIGPIPLIVVIEPSQLTIFLTTKLLNPLTDSELMTTNQKLTHVPQILMDPLDYHSTHSKENGSTSIMDILITNNKLLPTFRMLTETTGNSLNLILPIMTTLPNLSSASDPLTD
jgi:hypothetical protein